MRFLFPLVMLVLPIAFGGCAGFYSTHTGRTNSNSLSEPQQKDASDTLTLIRRITPRFSESAKHEGVYGCVEVGFDVDPKGRPVNVTAWNSIPSRVFDKNVISAVKRWRFRSTRDGKPAWTYGVFQQVDFSYGVYETSREQAYASWLCNQPPPRPVLVRRALRPLGGWVAIAYSPGETIAYLADSAGTAVPGSAKIRFCVSHEGVVEKVRILHSGPDPRYGLLGVSVLQSWGFHVFKIDGNSLEACNLTWSIPFVTRQPRTRFTFIDPSGGIKVFLVAKQDLTQNTEPKPAFVAPNHTKEASVGFCINADGYAHKEKLLNSSHDSKLDSTALKVVHDFLFFPQHSEQGTPVGSCGWRTTVQFMRAPSPASVLRK